jgi:hypothetical protein
MVNSARTDWSVTLQLALYTPLFSAQLCALTYALMYERPGCDVAPNFGQRHNAGDQRQPWAGF